VPVGGCFVVAAAKVVLTQPDAGDFKAFSAICTHQGCTVSDGSDGVIPCTCHGSQFSLADGSVVQGPATRPLDEVDIAVEGDSISLA
jgi:Rieske Fe-S protein